MTARTRALIEAHWSLANRRSWSEFGALLHPALRYEVPQTREYIEGGQGYLELFRTWPGDWSVSIRELVCEDDRGICVIDFKVGSDTTTSISMSDRARLRRLP